MDPADPSWFILYLCSGLGKFRLIYDVQTAQSFCKTPLLTTFPDRHSTKNPDLTSNRIHGRWHVFASPCHTTRLDEWVNIFLVFLSICHSQFFNFVHVFSSTLLPIFPHAGKMSAINIAPKVTNLSNQLIEFGRGEVSDCVIGGYSSCLPIFVFMD